jgi:hypothetical protein
MIWTGCQATEGSVNPVLCPFDSSLYVIDCLVQYDGSPMP